MPLNRSSFLLSRLELQRYGKVLIIVVVLSSMLSTLILNMALEAVYAARVHFFNKYDPRPIVTHGTWTFLLPSENCG